MSKVTSKNKKSVFITSLKAEKLFLEDQERLMKNYPDIDFYSFSWFMVMGDGHIQFVTMGRLNRQTTESRFVQRFVR